MAYAVDIHTHEVLYANRYTTELFGDIKSKICWKVLQKDQTGPCSFCKNHKIVDQNGNPAKPYHWVHQNSLTGRWYDITAVAFVSEDGRIAKFEIAFDITETKQSIHIHETPWYQALTADNLRDQNRITVMCQNCSKVRDLKHQWHSLIPLVEAHLNTHISIGICPDCAQKYYPGFHII